MIDPEAFYLMTQTYKLILATSGKEFEAVKELRKEVLLEKYRQFATIEDEEAFAWDHSDEQSFLFLIQHQASDRYVGTIRVFYMNEHTPIQMMPMEHYTHAPKIKTLRRSLPVCEISRFALSMNLPQEEERSALWIRTHLSLLLMIGSRLTAQIYPFEMIFAIMEYSLARLLRRQSAYFEQIGESVDYYGMRTPFSISREKLLEDTKTTEPISQYYLDSFCQDGTILTFLEQNPYLDKEMLQLPHGC